MRGFPFFLLFFLFFPFSSLPGADLDGSSAEEGYGNGTVEENRAPFPLFFFSFHPNLYFPTSAGNSNLKRYGGVNTCWKKVSTDAALPSFLPFSFFFVFGRVEEVIGLLAFGDIFPSFFLSFPPPLPHKTPTLQMNSGLI